MRLLLDGHAFLWFVSGDRRLGDAARLAIESPEAEPHLSLATVWELAIKVSVGRLTMAAPFHAFMTEKLATNLRLLPIRLPHALAIHSLPFHHRDPFDRMVIAQALVDQMPVVTRDRVFSKYGVEVVW